MCPKHMSHPLDKLIKGFCVVICKDKASKRTFISIPILRLLFEELTEGSWYLVWRWRQNWLYKVGIGYHPKASGWRACWGRSHE